MFWKRATPWGGFWGLVAGTLGAVIGHFAFTGLDIGSWHVWDPWVTIESTQSQNFYGAIIAFVADAVVTVVVSLMTAPKPERELAGLVERGSQPRRPAARTASRSGGSRRSCSVSARWVSPSSSA